MEQWLGVVGFPSCVGVRGLKIDGSSRFTILLGTDDHPVAPCDWLTNGHGF